MDIKEYLSQYRVAKLEIGFYTDWLNFLKGYCGFLPEDKYEQQLKEKQDKIRIFEEIRERIPKEIEQLDDEIGYSLGHTYRIHKKALAHMDKIVSGLA